MLKALFLFVYFRPSFTDFVAFSEVSLRFIAALPGADMARTARSWWYGLWCQYVFWMVSMEVEKQSAASSAVIPP